MNSIDDDAKLIGIDTKIWKEFRGMTDEKYVQDDLPGMLEAETEARESKIDHEAFLRRKQALAHRWFGYYRKCKDQKKKMLLIDQYNRIAKVR